MLTNRELMWFMVVAILAAIGLSVFYGPVTPSNALVGSVYRYANIPATANAATPVKAAGGQLHTININTKGATGNVLVVYDSLSASGTKIATIDTTVTFGTLYYDVVFGTGLTIGTANGTPADVTVSYD